MSRLKIWWWRLCLRRPMGQDNCLYWTISTSNCYWLTRKCRNKSNTIWLRHTGNVSTKASQNVQNRLRIFPLDRWLPRVASPERSPPMSTCARRSWARQNRGILCVDRRLCRWTRASFKSQPNNNCSRRAGIARRSLFRRNHRQIFSKAPRVLPLCMLPHKELAKRKKTRWSS